MPAQRRSHFLVIILGKWLHVVKCGGSACSLVPKVYDSKGYIRIVALYEH